MSEFIVLACLLLTLLLQIVVFKRVKAMQALLDAVLHKDEMPEVG